MSCSTLYLICFLVNGLERILRVVRYEDASNEGSKQRMPPLAFLRFKKVPYHECWIVYVVAPTDCFHSFCHKVVRPCQLKSLQTCSGQKFACSKAFGLPPTSLWSLYWERVGRLPSIPNALIFTPGCSYQSCWHRTQEFRLIDTVCIVPQLRLSPSASAILIFSRV